MCPENIHLFCSISLARARVCVCVCLWWGGVTGHVSGFSLSLQDDPSLGVGHRARVQGSPMSVAASALSVARLATCLLPSWLSRSG